MFQTVKQQLVSHLQATILRCRSKNRANVNTPMLPLLRNFQVYLSCSVNFPKLRALTIACLQWVNAAIDIPMVYKVSLHALYNHQHSSSFIARHMSKTKLTDAVARQLKFKEVSGSKKLIWF